MGMNTREHATMKMRGSSDISYLGQAVDSMIYDFMREHEIPGLTLAIVQARISRGWLDTECLMKSRGVWPPLILCGRRGIFPRLCGGGRYAAL